MTYQINIDCIINLNLHHEQDINSKAAYSGVRFCGEKMLQICKINNHLSVSRQIHNDISDIVVAGYRSIICNRSDNEDLGQPSFADIEIEIKKHNLEARWQPVCAGTLQEIHGREFGELLNILPSPVLAYCRSGTRSIMLWALFQARKRSVSDILYYTTRAGYDISGLVPKLKAIKSRYEI